MPNHAPRVAIIDYQMSNLFSVQHACEYVGLDSVITSDPDVVRSADAAILPGVGAFGDAMNNLHQLGLDEAIHEVITAQKPLFGICLGLQLLFATSDEFGHHQGLNIIPGHVTKFPAQATDGTVIKVPQIGWNAIQPSSHPGGMKWSDTPLRSVRPGAFMYFVHSYYVVPSQPTDILTETTYEGLRYCSGIARQNILAVQFHPEKSGPEGVQIYKNWAQNIH